MVNMRDPEDFVLSGVVLTTFSHVINKLLRGTCGLRRKASRGLYQKFEGNIKPLVNFQGCGGGSPDPLLHSLNPPMMSLDHHME